MNFSKPIRIRGLSLHNLKNIDLDIPLGRLVVVTGPSGAGKSSLVFDSIYAESQRRFVETFSPYARQYLERLPRPVARAIENLPAAVAIEQKNPVRNARSTVGTLAELNWPARLLFYRMADLVCPGCGRTVQQQGPGHVAEYVQGLGDELSGRQILLLTVTLPGERASDMLEQGWFRCLEAGRIERLEAGDAAITGMESVEFVIDRFRLDKVRIQRVKESAEQAFALGDGLVNLVLMEGGTRVSFSRDRYCSACGRYFNSASPALFSFNSPGGACPECTGFGRIQAVDPDLVVPDAGLSIRQGAVRPFETRRRWKARLVAWCREAGIDSEASWGSLSEEIRQEIFKGRGKWPGIEAFFRKLDKKRYKPHIRMLIARYRTYLPCPSCRGGRFRQETLWYRLGGLTLPEFYSLTIDEGTAWCDRVLEENRPDQAALALLDDLRHRLDTLNRAGISYLTMNRASRTLSGGEAARINMARAMGTRLTHTLYCVDEPSTGLHAADSRRLVAVLRGLVRAGNSVVAVDNDPVIAGAADMVIELGPGSGSGGGQVVYQGPPKSVRPEYGIPGGMEVNELLGHYGTGGETGNGQEARRAAESCETGDGIELSGVSEHNLCSVDVRFPSGRITCISGISGSGKSTLAEDVLYRAVLRELGMPSERPGRHHSMDLPENVVFVQLVDQTPPARTPRACPATALGLLDTIRKIFAATADARGLGLSPGSFSFNTAGGRCEECGGRGSQVIEMQFLPDLTLPCPHCRGKRFGREVLSVRYRHRNISDCLEMTISDAADFFRDSAPLVRRMKPAINLGLGHLCLGQALNTLSAGEIQRLKLAEYLRRGSCRETGLFILDEPTRGLHCSEVRLLMAALKRIAHRGNTVVVVEHDLGIIAGSDHVIDLGPGGGSAGGRVVYAGRPSGLVRCDMSVTGRMLREAGFFGQGLGTAAEESEHDTLPASYLYRQAREAIRISGARHHNLKDISVEIPHGRMVVITGVSGSGKSTLAFDCIFSEGQRRYVEGLSSYMRQFVTRYQRPDVDCIAGLTPSVAIEQRTSRSGPMSTVATLTETAHYLRLLYARAAVPWCTRCGVPMSSMTQDEIVKAITEKWQGRRIMVAAPRIIRRRGRHLREIDRGIRHGISRFFIDGHVYRQQALPSLSRYREHSVSWITGEVILSGRKSEALTAVVAGALETGHGVLSVLAAGVETGPGEHFFSTSHACPRCCSGAQEPDPLLFSFSTSAGRCGHCSGRGRTERGTPCPECRGSRLNIRARSWRIAGMGIERVLALEISEALDLLGQWLEQRPWPRLLHDIAVPLVESVRTRMMFLEEIGLGYLPLDLAGDCLSGGEAQRIRLAVQAGSGLSGVTVVLDEPTIGLHPMDNARLIAAMKRLRDAGNSVIVVEHDEETLRASDWIIDLGPGGGSMGGKVVACGRPEDVLKCGESATASAMRDKNRRTLRPGIRIETGNPMLSIRGVRCMNIRGIDIGFPLNAMTVVTGVSGAGKSTLVTEVLEPALRHVLNRVSGRPPCCMGMDGVDVLRRVVMVDHSPIGRTPRSCPATYTGVWTGIRNLLARVPEARNRGYGPGRFSFNLQGGRCEACAGQGSIKVSLGYLPDVYILCDECGGKRFEPATLEIRWKGRSVAEILSMTMDEAREFFRPVPGILKHLSIACELGLGYLTLGQPAPSLSGGEAQRMKLAKELVSASNNPTVYLLDEPTTGLHMRDVGLLVRHLQRLVARGGTVVVIEHNMDVISAADWIVDLGPGGGRRGGKLLFSGTPRSFLRSSVESATREALKRHVMCG